MEPKIEIVHLTVCDVNFFKHLGLEEAQEPSYGLYNPSDPGLAWFLMRCVCWLIQFFLEPKCRHTDGFYIKLVVIWAAEVK